RAPVRLRLEGRSLDGPAAGACTGLAANGRLDGNHAHCLRERGARLLLSQRLAFSRKEHPVKTFLAVIALVAAAGAAGWFLARGSEHAVSLGQPPHAAAHRRAGQDTG